MSEPDERWARAQRGNDPSVVSEPEDEPCKDKQAARLGQCAYANFDGSDACGTTCRIGNEEAP